MRIAPGFDKRNRKFYRWALMGMWLTAGLMLFAGFLGRFQASSPGGGVYALLFPGVAFVTAIVCYAIIDRVERSSFPLLISVLAYALGMYGFGMPIKLVVLVGAAALVGIIVILVFGDKADLQVEDDNGGI